MKFTVRLKPWCTPQTAINRCGYATFYDPNTGETSFVKRASAYFYPRYHCYIERQNGDVLSLTLHLDMKQPSYLPGKAHSGVYEGNDIEREASRMQSTIAALTTPSETQQDFF